MVVFTCVKTTIKFNKNVTSIWHDEMLSVNINFHQLLESTGRMDEALRPKKECILTNAITPFGGSGLTVIQSFGIKWLSLTTEMENTLGFVMPNRVRYAAVKGTSMSADTANENCLKIKSL